jgi:hypothetical protein
VLKSFGKEKRREEKRWVWRESVVFNVHSQVTKGCEKAQKQQEEAELRVGRNWQPVTRQSGQHHWQVASGIRHQASHHTNHITGSGRPRTEYSTPVKRLQGEGSQSMNALWSLDRNAPLLSRKGGLCR